VGVDWLCWNKGALPRRPTWPRQAYHPGPRSTGMQGSAVAPLLVPSTRCRHGLAMNGAKSRWYQSRRLDVRSERGPYSESVTGSGRWSPCLTTICPASAVAKVPWDSASYQCQLTAWKTSNIAVKHSDILPCLY
jgi:hypothetical protein